jgi:peptidoglycan/LPS O-acetylase OafA/YrhL
VKYRPELDGMRGIALIAVLAFHSYVLMSDGGWMAVDIFFVLSGYLITVIALNEHGKTGEIKLRAFYLRRLLRLYPALIVALVLGAFFYRYLGDTPTIGGYARTAGVAGAYLENLVFGLSGDEYGRFGHTWSLAVEAQFYVLWPLLLVWMLRNNKPLIPVTLGIAAVSFALFVLQSGGQYAGRSFAPAYYLPWTRFWELLLGCAVGMYLMRRDHGLREPGAEPKKRWVGWVIVFAMGFTVLVASTFTMLANSRHLVWQAPIIALLTVVLLIHLHRVGDRGVGSLLASWPAASLGKISYAVYIYHYPITWILRDKYDVADASDMFLLVSGISIAMSAASYRFIEKPALRLKNRLHPRQVSEEIAAAPPPEGAPRV